MFFRIFTLQPVEKDCMKSFVNTNVRKANSAYKLLRYNAEDTNPPTPYDRIERDQALDKHTNNFAQTVGNSKNESLDQLMKKIIHQKNRNLNKQKPNFPPTIVC